MSYSKYEVFLKVIESGSMSRAATVCNYSQSAVSQIISSLEKELQVKLMKRSQTGVQLTSDGEHMLPYIRQISQAEKQLQTESDRLRGVESGSIRIGSFSSVACHIMVPLLTEFKRYYPDINIEVREGDNMQIESWLTQGSVDFGFVGAPAPVGFETITIYKDPFVAVIPEGSELSNMKIIPLSQFEKTPMVLFDEGTRKEAAGLLHKNKIKTNVAYVSRDDNMILSLIENGLCIGFMGRLILNRTSYNVAYRATQPQLYREIVLTIRSIKNASSASKKFIGFMEEHLKAVISELEF